VAEVIGAAEVSVTELELLRGVVPEVGVIDRFVLVDDSTEEEV
jgi:hypothetical protein